MMKTTAVILSGLLPLMAATAASPIPADHVSPVSQAVSARHLTAQLVAETAMIDLGGSFGIVLHLVPEPGWHTYWKNPGDSGLPTTVTWTLPPGFTAGPLQWPAPERIDTGGEISYGYDGDAYLLTTITAPSKGPLPNTIPIHAHATWLVCKNVCIPGTADLDFTLTPGTAWTTPETAGFFSAVRQLLPVKNTEWKVTAHYLADTTEAKPTRLTKLALQFTSPKKWTAGGPQSVTFFPFEQNVLKSTQRVQFSKTNDSFVIEADLEPNGDKPKQISGVLVSDTPLVGTARSFVIGPISIQNNVTP